jgi:hypothetical protein
MVGIMEDFYFTKTMWTTIKEIMIGMGLSLFAFFAPAAAIILVVLGFVFVDTLTAYMRVKKEQKKQKDDGEEITIRWRSRTFIKGFAPKLTLYTICILLFFALDMILLNEFVGYFIKIPHFTTKVISLGLIYGELKSIDENWRKIFGKGLIKYIMDLLNFTKKIKDKMDDVNKDKE